MWEWMRFSRFFRRVVIVKRAVHHIEDNIDINLVGRKINSALLIVESLPKFD